MDLDADMENSDEKPKSSSSVKMDENELNDDDDSKNLDNKEAAKSETLTQKAAQLKKQKVAKDKREKQNKHDEDDSKLAVKESTRSLNRASEKVKAMDLDDNATTTMTQQQQ